MSTDITGGCVNQAVGLHANIISFVIVILPLLFKSAEILVAVPRASCTYTYEHDTDSEKLTKSVHSVRTSRKLTVH